MVVLIALVLAGCGRSSLKDELVNTGTWDGIMASGTSGEIIFKDDGTFIAKYGAIESSYNYEINEDKKQITYWNIKDDKKKKPFTADVEKTDDGFIFNGTKDHVGETLTLIQRNSL